MKRRNQHRKNKRKLNRLLEKLMEEAPEYFQTQYERLNKGNINGEEETIEQEETNNGKEKINHLQGGIG
jgi:cysteine synthase